MWSRSGNAIRGLAALLLWNAGKDRDVPVAWRVATDPHDPESVVVPLRSKRSWSPVALVPGPRLGALSVPILVWDEERIDRTMSALRPWELSALAPISGHIHELMVAFVQSLRRHSNPGTFKHRDWSIQSLSIAANVAATLSDAAYGVQVGSMFAGETLWQRSDVSALYPWETQCPEDGGGSWDRILKREGARVLKPGKRPGQLPMRQDAVLRLDNLWEHGEILEGYSRILRAAELSGVVITGDAVHDARSLGRALASRVARGDELPNVFALRTVATPWQRLRLRVIRRSWPHRLQGLRFRDLRGDRRWHPDRIIPRVRKSILRSGRQTTDLSSVELSVVGLVRLLDAMGPKRPQAPPETLNVKAEIGTVVNRTYQRRAIYKADGTVRWLDVPNPELAASQRMLVRLLRPSAPFAGVATAFEPGRSPAIHARIHEGALAAVVVDIRDFFGSIRPAHLRWAFHPRQRKRTGGERKVLLDGGGKRDREELIRLLFASDGEGCWLPQGAPSSPWAANLAAHPMDRRLRAWAREWGDVHYSRYADDLVLSLHRDCDSIATVRFLDAAERALREAIKARGWTVREEKTRRWRRSDRSPLTLCGVEVPDVVGAPCRLPRVQHRRVRAALHHLRCGDERWDHGLLAWAWGATGQPGWLAWGCKELSRFAIQLGGSVLAEALIGGWADSVDGGEEV